MTSHRIIVGDCRRMPELADATVHLVVTSPPYWQLKDYGPKQQIGYDDSYENYINHLNLVWQECWRVLHPGCRLCVNIGDQFARAAYYGRYKIMPIRTEIIKFCETVGFDYMGAIIWQKVTTCNTSGGATIMGSFPFPRNGMLKLDYEFILIFKKPGATPPASAEVKERSRMSQEEWKTYFQGHWNFPGEKQSKHLAMFPEELPRRLIKMFTFVGETVLDPFLGSGTTSLAARNLRRNSVGYEINEEFAPVIQEKLGLRHGALFGSDEVVLTQRKKAPTDHMTRIAALPYVFHDPIRFDKKNNPKERTYGSKIDATSRKKEDYFRVREILSPTRLLLNNGQYISLLGIKEIPGRNGDAIEFLKKLTKGSKVFFRKDKKVSEDSDQVYLYLINKTFINAHLIKNKLVDVDTESNYKYKERFLKYL
ncbi:MAG TPA: DNA methylase N-4 [Desulfobacterales bacterium]|nr:DNA methylase N-4 [Desulfobacterales bacterium]